MLKHIFLSTNTIKYIISFLCFVQTCKLKKKNPIILAQHLQNHLAFKNPVREKIIDGVPRSSLGLMCVSRVLTKLTHELSELQAIIF